MTDASLNPLHDAAEIATRLHAPNAELLIVIGAEAWCEKCQRLRPVFEQLCRSRLPPYVLWMWMDLEDHAEFLGDFVPPDLPLMLRWRSGRCAQAALVLDIQPVPEAGHQHLQQRELIVQDDQLIDPADGSISRVPDLWQSLLRAGAGMLRST